MFIKADTANTIEAQLAKALERVTWIGELEISREDFGILAKVVHAQGKPQYVGKRTLATSMVFSARYAEFDDDEAINFWSRYLKDVWIADYDQTLAGTCRKYFRDARAFLQNYYGMEFPDRSETNFDVVSGVYMHAILPSYLLDDFAEFLLRVMPDVHAWQAAVDQSVEQIAQAWQHSLQPLYLRKRLFNFLTHSETSSTAARLAQTLATAALWYSENQDAAFIRASLAPIEQAVWDQLVPRLQGRNTQGKMRARTPGVRVRWAWLYEENDILELHVKNLPLKGESPPDRLVWLPLNDAKSVKVGETAPDYGTAFCEVNAWQTDTGYSIDSGILIDVDEIGAVVAVDQRDRVLSAPFPTGNLPSEDIVFFQLQSDERLAVLTEHTMLKDGMYAVSFKSSVALASAQDQTPLKPVRQLMVPRILKGLGHDRAGVYEIKLPILIGEKRIEKRRAREAPAIVGARPLAGLIPSAMPIYEHGDIWIVFTPPTGVPIERLSLRITVDNAPPKVISILDLKKQSVVEEQEQRLRVQLNGMLPESCLFQVEVFSGLTCLNNEPLIAALLPPEVIVESPTPDKYHTTDRPPMVIIKGVSREKIELASDATVTQNEKGISIQWCDPRQDAALRLHIGEVSIPLTFDTRWSYAWAEPLNGTLLWEDALPEAILHVRSAPHSRFSINVADCEPRYYQLNARGVFDTKLSTDALIDILRAYQGERVPVHLQFGDGDKPIHLFTLIRPSFADFERKPELIKQSVRAFRAKMRASRRKGQTQEEAMISLLPITYLSSLSESDVPPPLKQIQDVAKRSYEEFEGVVFPKRVYHLAVSPTISYPLVTAEKGWQISLVRWINGHQETVKVPIRQEGTVLYAQSKKFYQCRYCGEFYWLNDTGSKIKHGHGKFSVDGIDLETSPIVGSIKADMPPIADLASFRIRFGAYIDESIERTFRLDASRKRAREISIVQDPLSLDYYRFATAQWVLRQGFDESLKSLRSSANFVDRIVKRLCASTLRPLSFTGQWILSQQMKRNIERNSWLMLDLAVMTVAAIARSYAHEYPPILQDDNEKALFTLLLNDAYSYCPELLTWALCWAEVFFTHWRHAD
jgi:hypothetical protein